MKYKIFFTIISVLFYLTGISNAPAQDALQIAISHPKYAVSQIPFSLEMHILNSKGETDTTFQGYLRTEGLCVKGENEVAALKTIGPFEKGTILVEKVFYGSAGQKTICSTEEDQSKSVTLRVIPGILSLLPPLLAILTALLLRQVFIALFAGIWLGSTFVWDYNPFLGLLRLLDHYLIQSLSDPGHASIIIFSMILGGMVGILSRSGGTQGIVQKLSRLASRPRGGQIAAWLMGLFIFFDDYANTLIVGNTMRPITDRLKISREKLSYIVDSTAAPVASMAVISTWIGFEMGLIQSAFSSLGIDRNIYLTFLQTIPYRFYSILTIVFVFAVALSNRDFGPMLKAEIRARKTGKVLRDNSLPLSDNSLSEMTAPQGTPLRWVNAVLPILVVIITTMTGLWYSGKVALGEQGITQASLKTIIGASDSLSVLLWSSFAGILTAALLAVSQRILKLREVLDACVSGMKAMFYAMIILIFAWSIGKICEDLHTADVVIYITRGMISPHLLPMITFVIAALISFATGTSWGTLSILIPLAIPIAYKFSMELALSPDKAFAILTGTIAAVLSGAVFGDHCSPISDTTIMSSMASGSDHIDHVRTQIPYAITVGLIAIAAGYLPAGFGFSPLFSIPVGLLLIIGVIWILGRNPEKHHFKPQRR